MREHWIDVKEAPDDYEVSNLGNVRRKKDGKILQGSINEPNGYKRVVINGQRRYVHRVVADSFFDGDHENMDVNHIDGDKLNNKLTNLEWCTRQENIRHAFINGLKFPSVLTVVRCKFCKNRGEFDWCEGRPDEFFCQYGER